MGALYSKFLNVDKCCVFVTLRFSPSPLGPRLGFEKFEVAAKNHQQKVPELWGFQFSMGGLHHSIP